MNLKNKPLLTKRKVVALLLAIMFLTTAFYVLTASNGGGATYITSGSFTEDYSYLISYKNSTHIQAKNGTTGTIDLESTNASYVWQTVIDACTNGGSILVKDGGGDYDFDTTILLPQVSERNFIIEGDTEQVTLTSTASKVFDVTATSWVGGYMGPSRVILRNFRIEHDTSASSDVGLDLYYGYVCLENIRIENTDATKRGTGILNGPKLGSLEVYYYNVRVRWYDIGINASMALMTYDNVRVIRPGTDAWVLHETGSFTMNNVGATLEPGGNMSVFHIYPGGGISGTITMVRCEALPTTGYIFECEATTYLDVFGVVPENSSWTSIVCNNFGYINIYSTWTYARTVNYGSVTVDNASTEWIVTHGLCGTPALGNVQVMPFWQTTWYIYSRNATHFVVYFGTAPSGSQPMGWHAQLCR